MQTLVPILIALCVSLLSLATFVTWLLWRLMETERKEKNPELVRYLPFVGGSGWQELYTSETYTLAIKNRKETVSLTAKTLAAYFRIEDLWSLFNGKFGPITEAERQVLHSAISRIQRENYQSICQSCGRLKDYSHVISADEDDEQETSLGSGICARLGQIPVKNVTNVTTKR